MRKTAVQLALVLALLITVASIPSVWANPYIEEYFPLKPTTTKPSIALESPIQNSHYNLDGAWLNFTITKPETWFVRDIAYTENHEPLTLAIGRITRIYYVLDNGEPKNITVSDGDLPSDFSIDAIPTQVFNFSVPLTLAGGLHSVKIGFEANTYYYTGWDVSKPGLKSAEVDGVTEEVNFSIAEPFPVVPLAAVALVAITIVAVSLGIRQRKCL